MMNCLILITSHLDLSQESGMFKFIVLIAAVILLLVALWICITISNKNKLYIKPSKKDRNLTVVKENEVA
jgi:hypothetical protein